ncbi:aminotransferase class I/II-fold pyridoxal phosphate-dependent enzyme [Ottowia sp.]|uniref:serine hydroxymethyltransferase n=1 Tax=Ottowia sp. TaxID=1898956 RepID=UPI002BD69438|nr:aminotransferase class I/II-fold pyridoxal phosphate-dependent enzyme [Ottowia sp.]HRN74754.1 aminotransferase class I/II-fold pyridoxal phosphate-dependent enzyme [Ottowia sp.]HRQ01906.1 aminotransferase class I/II-fold pyridoxal phosphate-dependent enzyme [Ottowia sp.]
MPQLAVRPWVPAPSESTVQALAQCTEAQSATELITQLDALIADNHRIHDERGINLNPASNVMNPRAEALLSCGLGTRASLGYPGDKYEVGLEAIEQIEVMAAELAAEVFGARYAEVRVASGALANLYVFMACCRAGDRIIAPPPDIGGHVTHHRAGAAGWFGLDTIAAPIDAERYSIDVDALRRLAHEARPRLITAGGSLNLFEHPVADLRAIADEVGAWLMFDAAHLSGMFAGRAWKNPLDEGAHVMTMSTYKSLGGPAGGLIVTNEAQLAERLDAIAYPGLTANFDAGRVAALARSLIDWRVHGQDYARAMQDTARALAQALHALGLPVHAIGRGATDSHQLALRAARWSGGQRAARHMARSGLLACGIGLPIDPVAGDVNGLRLGVPEIVRLGMGPSDMPALARLIERALQADAPPSVADEVAAFRSRFSGVHYVR